MCFFVSMLLRLIIAGILWFWFAFRVRDVVLWFFRVACLCCAAGVDVYFLLGLLYFVGIYVLFVVIAGLLIVVSWFLSCVMCIMCMDCLCSRFCWYLLWYVVFVCLVVYVCGSLVCGCRVLVMVGVVPLVCGWSCLIVPWSCYVVVVFGFDVVSCIWLMVSGVSCVFMVGHVVGHVVCVW